MVVGRLMFVFGMWRLLLWDEMLHAFGCEIPSHAVFSFFVAILPSFAACSTSGYHVVIHEAFVARDKLNDAMVVLTTKGACAMKVAYC